MILQNIRMEEYLEEYNENTYVTPQAINTFKYDIVNKDNCFILHENDISDINDLLIDVDEIQVMYGDYTGFEASYNHIHISSVLLEDDLNHFQVLQFGFELLEEIKKKLKIKFPGEIFSFILSHGEDDTNIRFHKYRVEDGDWIDIDDLDGYENGIHYSRIKF